MRDRDYLIALGSFVPFGPIRVKLLVEYFRSAKKSFLASERELLDIGVSREMARDFVTFRIGFSFDAFSKNLSEKEIRVIVKGENEYPLNLSGVEDAPTIIFVRGKILPTDINSVAIVGSRNMTSYGRDITSKLAIELAQKGITIISGLAFGIDLVAHRSAVEAGGRCIAVLASGVDYITPRSNEWLGSEILRRGGALVSEYPPGTLIQKYFFPYRNRIISGLSRAVVIVEGLIKSGTIHTANHAADQGRTVFAVPGRVDVPTSEAPHYLIKNGARIFTKTQDILDEMGV